VYNSTLSLTSVLHSGGCSTPRLGQFTPRQRPHIDYIEGWVGHRSGLYGCGKSTGFDPRIVQPVASGCTHYAILANPYRWTRG